MTPQELVEAVIWKESGGNPNAVSPVGARGLMQVMPATARDPGFGVQPVDPDSLFDPAVNRKFGEQYLGAMLNRYKGDTRKALAAYNWGAGNADKWDGDLNRLPAETRDYITKIEGKLAEGGGATPIMQGDAGSDVMVGGQGDDTPKRSPYFDSFLEEQNGDAPTAREAAPPAPVAGDAVGASDAPVRSPYFDSFLEDAEKTRLSESDRESPLPDDLIEEGKAIMDGDAPAAVPEGMVYVPGKDGRVGRYVDTKAEAELNAAEGGIRNYVGALAGEVLRGVPFAGEYLDEASGALDEAMGGTPGLVRERVRAQQERFQEDNPKAAIAANLAGGIASGGLAAKGLAPAVKAVAPASMAGKVAVGTGAGVALGATEGAVGGYGAGTTDEERKQKALSGAAIGGGLGGVLGAAAPVLAKGGEGLIGYFAGGATRRAARGLGVSPEAADVAGRMIASDGTDTAMRNIDAAGEGAMLADAGPATAGLLDATIQAAGPGGRIAREAIAERSASAGGEINTALDQFLGKPQGLKGAGRAIAEKTSAARRAAYDAAYDTPINYASPEGAAVEDVLSRIPQRQMTAAITDANEEMVSQGLQNQQIMAKLADDGTVAFVEMPNVRQLDALKQALDRAGSVEDIFGRPTQEAIRPRRLARQLRKALGDAVVTEDGVKTYNEAVKLGGQKIAEDNALKTGRRILQPNFTREDVADALETASTEELKQAKVGLRSQIDEVISNVKRSMADSGMDAREGVKAMKELSSTATREKISIVLGKGPAKALMSKIDTASKAFELAARTADNSKTFARGEFKSMIADITEPGAIGKLMEGSPVQASKALVQAMTKMSPAARREQEERIAGEIATALTSLRGARAKSGINSVINALDKQPETAALAKRIGDLTGALTAGGGYGGASALIDK